MTSLRPPTAHMPPASETPAPGSQDSRIAPGASGTSGYRRRARVRLVSAVMRAGS